jgi:hypothetical protein
MTHTERIADIVETLDWTANTLAQDGIECSDLRQAADALADIRLEIERKQFSVVAA